MKLILASEFSNSFGQLLPFIGDLKDKSVVLIETAAAGEGVSPDPKENSDLFKGHGAVVTSYDLKDKCYEEVEQVLSQTDILYVCGGNTFYLLEHMKACGFENLLKKRLAQGMIYIGSSAGSIVTGPDIAFIAPMDDARVANLDDTKGLGLVDFMIVPHLGHETMGKAAHIIVSSHQASNKLFVLHDGQALVIEQEKFLFV